MAYCLWLIAWWLSFIDYGWWTICLLLLVLELAVQLDDQKRGRGVYPLVHMSAFVCMPLRLYCSLGNKVGSRLALCMQGHCKKALPLAATELPCNLH